MTVESTIALGFLLGMRHATEADHVAAVAARDVDHPSELIMRLVLRYLILVLVFVPALALLVAAQPQDTGAEDVSRDCATQVAGVTRC